MSQAAVERPNRPAPPAPLTPEQLRAYLEYELDSDRIRGKELLAALQKTLEAYPTINTEEEQGVASENRRLAEVWLREAEKKRESYKAPILTLGRTLDAWFAALTLPFGRIDKRGQLIDGPLKAIKSRMNAYADKKFEAAQAIARAEAARLQREADERTRIAQEALAEQQRQERLARELREEAERQQSAGLITSPSSRLFPAAVPTEPVDAYDVEYAERQQGAAQQRAQATLADAAHAAAAASKAAEVAESRPSAFTRTTGPYGSTTFSTRKWEPEVFDEAAVPRQYLGGPDMAKVRRAGAAAEHAPDGKPLIEISGIRWVAIDSTQVRGA